MPTVLVCGALLGGHFYFYYYYVTVKCDHTQAIAQKQEPKAALRSLVLRLVASRAS